MTGGSCSGGGCAKKCSMAMLAHWLLIIGGLNWLLVGLGWLVSGSDWNVVHMLLKSLPMWVEALVYVLVGLSALVAIWGCCCKTCKATT